MPLEARVESDEELVWLVDDSTEVRIAGRTFHCLQPGVFLVPPRFADALRSLIRDIPAPIRRTFKRYESDPPDPEEEAARYKALRKPRPLKRKSKLLPVDSQKTDAYRCLICGRPRKLRPGLCSSCIYDPRGTLNKLSPGLKYQADDDEERALRDWISARLLVLESTRDRIVLHRKNESGRRILHRAPLGFDNFGEVNFEGSA